jgi:hypothetical protein
VTGPRPGRNVPGASVAPGTFPTAAAGPSPATACPDYGDLTAARAAGQHSADFNREQQASICEDCYDVTNGLRPDYGATEAELDPFIAGMRAGKF